MVELTASNHQLTDEEQYAALYSAYERIYLAQSSVAMPVEGKTYDVWGIKRRNNDELGIPVCYGRLRCLCAYPYRYDFEYINSKKRLEITINDLKAGLIVVKAVEEGCPLQLIPVKKAV